MNWVTTSTVLEHLHDPAQAGTWEVFTGHFTPRIAQFAQRAGLGTADSQDFSQDVLMGFVEGYRAGRYDRSKGRLRSWLYGIARNQLTHLLRSRGLRKQEELPEGSVCEGLEVVDSELERVWEEEWQAAVYQHCLRRLKNEVAEDTFEIFRMLVFDHASPTEVADKQGCDVARVYNVRSRVSKRFRELAREYEDA